MSDILTSKTYGMLDYHTGHQMGSYRDAVKFKFQMYSNVPLYEFYDFSLVGNVFSPTYFAFL